MSGNVRDLYYSPLCDTDYRAYLAFLLVSSENGSVVKQLEEKFGARRGEQYNGSYDNNGEYVDNSGDCFRVEAADASLGARVFDAVSPDKFGVVGSGSSGYRRDTKSVGWLAVGDIGDIGSSSCGGFCNDTIQDGQFCHTKDTSEPLVVSRGRWFKKNMKKRIGKNEKKKKMQQNWRGESGVEVKQVVEPQVQGFWNNCSAAVRQELIDSKARMHVAENKRREQQATEQFDYANSPEATMRKAVKMVELAQKHAERENDNRVYGWAKTVATSSAESLARSVPSTVPSFDDLSAKLEASSQSSFELELRAKQDEFDEFKKTKQIELDGIYATIKRLEHESSEKDNLVARAVNRENVMKQDLDAGRNAYKELQLENGLKDIKLKYETSGCYIPEQMSSALKSFEKEFRVKNKMNKIEKKKF